MRVLSWALMVGLAAATVMVVPGMALALAGPLVGWEVRGEEAASPLPLPNTALVVARPRPPQEIGAGALVLTQQGLFRVLALQRVGEGIILLAQREADGATLSLAPGGPVLVAEVVVPYMGYGLDSRPWAKALLGVPVALAALALWQARGRRRPVAQEAASAQAPPMPPPQMAMEVPGEEAPPAEAMGEGAAPEEGAGVSGGALPPLQDGPGPQKRLDTQEELDGGLLDIFRRASQEVREHTLAAEVEEVDIRALIAQLREVRKSLGRGGR